MAILYYPRVGSKVHIELNRINSMVRPALLLLILSIVLCRSVYTCHSENANQESLEMEHALCFLREVTCIDLDAYTLSLNWTTRPPIVTQYLYPGHVRTFIRAHFINSKSEIDAEIDLSMESSILTLFST